MCEARKPVAPVIRIREPTGSVVVNVDMADLDCDRPRSCLELEANGI